MNDPVSRIEADARAKWNSDPKIKAEFGTFSTFLAFQKARADGAVRIYGGGKVVGAGPVPSVCKPTLRELLGPPEVPNPAPTPNAAAVAAFHALDAKIQDGLEAIKEKHGVEVREFSWTPEHVEVRVK